VSRRRRISRCQACSGVDDATIGSTAVVLPAVIQKRAEPIAIRVPDLEFVARSIGQRWIGEKLSTELRRPSASCGSAVAKALSASGADGSIAAVDGVTKCQRSHRVIGGSLGGAPHAVGVVRDNAADGGGAPTRVTLSIDVYGLHLVC
jgi:hypothetical protein